MGPTEVGTWSWSVILPALFAVTASFSAGFPVNLLLKRYGIIDRPNARSCHVQPVVRGGGISFLIPILAGIAWLAMREREAVLACFVGMTLVLCLVSFRDDMKPFGALLRFGFHSMATLMLMVYIGREMLDFRFTDLPALKFLSCIGGIMVYFWLIGFINAFNFMDGINGLAAGQACISSVGMVLVAWQWGIDPSDWWVTACLVVSGAAAGFFPHNFPKARMFMGDVGSTSLGYILGGLTIIGCVKYGWEIFLPLALLQINFVLDTGLTLIRRVFRGEKWYEAHREHFYQRLIGSGKSHQFVTGIELFLLGVTVGLVSAYPSAPTSMKLLLVTAVICLWLIFFVYCEIAIRRFRQEVASRCIKA